MNPQLLVSKLSPISSSNCPSIAKTSRHDVRRSQQKAAALTPQSFELNFALSFRESVVSRQTERCVKYAIVLSTSRTRQTFEQLCVTFARVLMWRCNWDFNSGGHSGCFVLGSVGNLIEVIDYFTKCHRYWTIRLGNLSNIN